MSIPTVSTTEEEAEARALYDLTVGLKQALEALDRLSCDCPVYIEGPWEFIGTVEEAKVAIEQKIRAALHFVNTVAEQAGWEAPAPESGF